MTITPRQNRQYLIEFTDAEHNDLMIAVVGCQSLDIICVSDLLAFHIAYLCDNALKTLQEPKPDGQVIAG